MMQSQIRLDFEDEMQRLKINENDVGDINHSRNFTQNWIVEVKHEGVSVEGNRSYRETNSADDGLEIWSDTCSGDPCDGKTSQTGSAETNNEEFFNLRKICYTRFSLSIKR